MLSGLVSSAAAATAGRRILCLHGRGATASGFMTDLAPLEVEAAKQGFELVAIDAVRPSPRRLYQPTLPCRPDQLPDDCLRHGPLLLLQPSGTNSWWTYPSGERSFSASKFFGADESIRFVEDTLVQGEFAGLLGFSQGAMLAAVVVARAALGEGDAASTLQYGVICGAALPAPFEALLSRLQASGGSSSIPTLHCLSAVDNMNPPALGEALATCFGPTTTEMLWHDAGHVVPPPDKVVPVVSFLDRVAPSQQ